MIGSDGPNYSRGELWRLRLGNPAFNEVNLHILYYLKITTSAIRQIFCDHFYRVLRLI